MITHYSLLITHYSLLITHYSLLITHYSLSIILFSFFLYHFTAMSVCYGNFNTIQKHLSMMILRVVVKFILKFG